MRSFRLFVAAHVACVFVPFVLAQEVADDAVGDAVEVQPISQEEKDIVESLIKRVQAEPPQSTPLDPYVVAMRRSWLLRTLERLEEFMADNPKLPQVATWRELLGLTEIRRELAKHQPDLSKLRWIRDEDLFSKDLANEERDFTKIEMFSREAAGEYENHQTDADDLGVHIVLSYMRAIARYVEALEVEARDDRFAERLKELADYLRQYIKTENLIERRSKIKAIHRIVEEIEASNQAEELTKYIRERYLYPQVRGFVSSRVLTHVAELFTLPSLPQTRYQDGTFVQGVATATQRLFVTGVQNDDIGVLEAGYLGPVVFSGTAQRKHINLGISANLDARFTKRLFLIHGAADTSRTSNRLGIGSTGSSGGHIVDRIVDKAIRRNFDADRISSDLAGSLDKGVTRAANFLETEVIKPIRKRIPEIRDPEGSGDITLAVANRSAPNGLQLTILSAREGFREPDEEPPSSLGGSQHEFSVSIRKGLLSNLLAGWQVKLQEVDSLLRSVCGLPERPVDDSLVISFPKNDAVVAETNTDNIEVTITMFVGPDEAKIRLYPRHENGTLTLSPTVAVPTNAALQSELASLLEDFKRIERIKLPDPATSDDGTAQSNVGDVTGLRFSLGKHYVTLSGEQLIAD